MYDPEFYFARESFLASAYNNLAELTPEQKEISEILLEDYSELIRLCRQYDDCYDEVKKEKLLNKLDKKANRLRKKMKFIQKELKK